MAVRFGPTRQRFRVRMAMRQQGKMPTPVFREAIQRAQERNRDLVVRVMRDRYALSHMGPAHHRSGTNTIEGYEATARQDGSLYVFNRRRNARRIEFGVAPYRGLGYPGSPRMPAPPAHQIFGNPLSFFWEREGRWFKGPVVHHPGQQADPIMRESVEELADTFVDNIESEIEEALARG